MFFQMRPNNAMFEEFLNFNNFFSDAKSVRTSTGRKKNCSILGRGNFGFLDSPKVILTENQIKTHIYPMSGLPQKFSSGHWTIRENLYKIEKGKNLSESKIKEIEKDLTELEENISKTTKIL